MQFKIQTNHGVTLVEVVIVSFIISIVALGIATVISDSFKAQNSIKNHTEVQNTVSLIRMILGDSDLCKNAFYEKQRPILYDTTLTSSFADENKPLAAVCKINMKRTINDKDNFIIEAGKTKFGGYQISNCEKIDTSSMYLSSPYPNSAINFETLVNGSITKVTKYIINFVINFEKINKENSFGSAIAIEKIPLTIVVNPATNEILSCGTNINRALISDIGNHCKVESKNEGSLTTICNGSFCALSTVQSGGAHSACRLINDGTGKWILSAFDPQVTLAPDGASDSPQVCEAFCIL